MSERKIKIIEAKPAESAMTPSYEIKKRKVAGYARVSTDKEEQLTSYQQQVDYYSNYIKSRPDWEFVGLYSDEGISGTSTKQRDGFNQMIADALDGKIDLIITKSVSRFARNTVDSLQNIRLLKEHNCECFFEKEGIYTFDSKGEVLLTIMSSLAQEESRSLSENVTWGKRKRFAEGKGVSVPFSHFLGYDKGEDGNLVINEEEAKIIRLIFKLFLDGMSYYGIAKELTSRGIKTTLGKDKWSVKSVMAILTNEKYKGDVLLQKKYVSDYLTKKLKTNKGELPQYYIEGNHPAIIEPEVFDEVQAQMKARSEREDKYNKMSIYSGKIQCGCCGGWYGSKVWHSNDEYRRIIYRCNRKYDNQVRCTSPHLTEAQIQEMFVVAVNQVISNKAEIIDNLLVVVETLQDSSTIEEQQQSVKLQMTKLTNKLMEMTQLNAIRQQDQDEFNRQYNDLVEQYNQLAYQSFDLDKKLEDNQARKQKLVAYIKALKDQEVMIEEFDDKLWLHMLEKIVVTNKDDIVVVFKDGSEIKVKEQS